MHGKNKRYRFTPELWTKWMARRAVPDPHTASLRAGIAQMRKSFEPARIETTVSINAKVSIEEIRSVLGHLGW